MKNKILFVLLAFVFAATGCKKDVQTTDPVDPPVIIIPPAQHLPDDPATDSINLALGNPSAATVDLNHPENYLMREGYYTLSYNRDRGISNWVSWHLSNEDLGTTPRQDDFRSNSNLPTTWYHVENYNYNGGGFDRGHMCPSGDRTASVAGNSSTFLMTNIVPQAPDNNQGPWAALEDYTRNLVTSGANEVYVVCGSYGEGGTGDAGDFLTISNGRITVPEYLWKVVVVMPKGDNDVSRITTATRVITVIMPNVNGLNTNWKTHRTSVDAVENATGLDILSNLPTAIQDVVELRVDNL